MEAEGTAAAAAAAAAAAGTPKKVKLSDQSAIKRMLDETVSEVLEHRGYSEDFRISNMKMVLGVLACAVALVAQFYPKKFPDNRPILIVCIALYVLFNAAIQLIVYLIEKNHILFTHPSRGSFSGTGLAVSSKLPRQSDMYTLRVASSDTKHIAARPPVEATKSVTKWFSEEGVFVEAYFWEDVQRLLDSYEKGSSRKKSK